MSATPAPLYELKDADYLTAALICQFLYPFLCGFLLALPPSRLIAFEAAKEVITNRTIFRPYDAALCAFSACSVGISIGGVAATVACATSSPVAIIFIAVVYVVAICMFFVCLRLHLKPFIHHPQVPPLIVLISAIGLNMMGNCLPFACGSLWSTLSSSASIACSVSLWQVLLSPPVAWTVLMLVLNSVAGLSLLFTLLQWSFHLWIVSQRSRAIHPTDDVGPAMNRYGLPDNL